MLDVGATRADVSGMSCIAGAGRVETFSRTVVEGVAIVIVVLADVAAGCMTRDVDAGRWVGFLAQPDVRRDGGDGICAVPARPD